MKTTKILIYLTISQMNNLFILHPEIIKNASIHLDSKTLLNKESERKEKFSIHVIHSPEQSPVKLIKNLL